MSKAGLSRPKLALPFTIVADRASVHLVAGEDVRYSIRAGDIASQFAQLLRGCNGSQSLESLLAVVSGPQRAIAREMIERLYGERIVLEAPVEAFHTADQYGAVVEGEGSLVDRLASDATNAKHVTVLCQQSLDYHGAMEFNRRCLHARDMPWMWVSTGPLSRGYVSPVFLPDAGPCLACLLRHFQRLSPVPELYDALERHGETGGHFAAASFPEEATSMLEQIARWKIRQISVTPPPGGLFQLHVLELDSMEVSLHRVFLDPTCPDCRDARLV